MLIFASIAQAQHDPLSTSEALDFSTVYQAALVAAPEAPATDAREKQASSFTAVGKRWTTNRPSWQASFIDDGLLDNVGLREIEAGVAVNLWRKGERQQAQELGNSYQANADKWENYFNLLIAGRVRGILAELTQAEVLLDRERMATAQAQRLLEITTALNQAGSVPEIDALQARSLVLEQRRIELEAEATLVDAERSYTQLTNLKVRPQKQHQETQSTIKEISADHPLLKYLQSEVNVASANVERVQRMAKGSPSMTLGVRRERGLRQQPYIDTFGLSFSVPFGGKAVVSAQTSSARSSKVDADIEYARAYQKLDTQLHEVEHELFVTEESLKLSLEQAQLSERRWQMSRAAFEAGENTLAQVVIALQSAQSSSKRHDLLKVQKQRLISEYNQAVGISP